MQQALGPAGGCAIHASSLDACCLHASSPRKLRGRSCNFHGGGHAAFRG